jgi:hypothetical protein
VRRAPIAPLAHAKLEARRRCDLAESGTADLEMCWYPNSCAVWRKGAQIGRNRTCYARRARAHLWLCHSEGLAVGRTRWRGGRSDFLRPIGMSKRVPRRALTYLKRDRWLYRRERRPIFIHENCTIFHAFRKTTAVISEFRGKSQFRLALLAEEADRKCVTFIAIDWDLSK